VGQRRRAGGAVSARTRIAAGLAVLVVGASGGIVIASAVEHVADSTNPSGTARSAATATASGCRKRKRIVIVNLDNRTQGQVLRHAWSAVAHGEPEVLHIDRPETDANRRASLRGVPLWSELTDAQRQRIDPASPQEPHDRDEFPPAVSDEGGKGADVAYVRASQNRAAGAVMGDQLSGWCNGQVFRFERKPGGHR
jgi:hypothetical protein